MRVVTRLQSALALPFTLEDKSVLLSISAGIALYPENGSCAAELMDNADVAQEQAKLSGQNHYTFYSSDLNKTATDRLALEEDLRYALEAKEFELYYQPKMDIRNQTAVGVEALLRWNSPARGFVSPMEFIPLCEQMGIIKPLGEWVLESACQQAKAWHSEMPELKVSVNVSSLQLDKDFIDTVKAVIAKSGLDPKCLDLEITEGIFLENKCMVSELFSELRSMGITISIDDFGTGYSSLSYLRDLPIDTLKIDRSFLMNIEEDDTSKAIVNSIITLANGLHLNTVAEGVEDVALLNFLIQGGCREVQGYLFSPPLPPEALSQWVLDVEAWRCHFSFT